VSQGPIALFGGSFDPPHVAHVLAVAWLLSAAPVRAVWVLPVARHPFGKALTPFADRLELCRRAFGLFGAAVVVRDDEAASSGRSIELVERLVAAHPGAHFRWVLGADQWVARARWHRFADLEALAPAIVLRRPGWAADDAPLASPPLPDLSSTELRQRLRDGAATDGLLPAAVAAYAGARGLYREGLGG
jgi:nicotinate-nucleotide adenylyltransferase